MIGVVADTSRMAWAWVVVLQNLGVDGLMWTTLDWSQNGFSMVRQCFQTYWERSTNSVCIENILLASCNGRILVRKLVHFDTDLFISIMLELGCTKFGIDQKNGASLDNPSWCISFSNFGPDDTLSFLELSHICGHEVFPSWLRILELKERPL